jgi:hypothetical protein
MKFYSCSVTLNNLLISKFQKNSLSLENIKKIIIRNLYHNLNGKIELVIYIAFLSFSLSLALFSHSSHPLCFCFNHFIYTPQSIRWRFSLFYCFLLLIFIHVFLTRLTEYDINAQLSSTFLKFHSVQANLIDTCLPLQTVLGPSRPFRYQLVSVSNSAAHFTLYYTTLFFHLNVYYIY